MHYKLILRLALLTLIIAPTLRAADVYFASASAGTNDGSSCANAHAVSTYNTFWLAGNTLHLCGVFNWPANTTLITASASGTSGSIITVKFESSTTLNSPVWPSTGAIDTNGFNFITIDGGGVGVIQNTANGSSLANHSATTGVNLRGDHLMAKNLTVQSMYIVTGNEGNLTCPSPGNCPGVNSIDIAANGGSNVEICNNTVSDAHIGIDSSSVSAAFTSPPAATCTDTQAAAGVNIYNNTTIDHGWQIHVGGNGHVNVFGNDMSNWSQWFSPTGPNAYHLDGVIAFPGATGIVHAHIWNNYIHGDFVNSSPTGFVFCTYGVPGSGSQCDIFNNLLVGTGGTVLHGRGIYFHSADGNPLGPHTIYNNDLSGFGDGAIYMDGDSTQHYTVENNVTVSGSGYYMLLNGTPTANYVSDYNIYTGARTICNFPCGFDGGKTLAQWQNLGEDVHGTEQNPLLNANFTLQSGSPAIGHGLNLTALGNALLDIGAPLNYGVGATCGAGCVARSPSAAWDMGALPSAAALLPSISLSRSIINFGAVNTGSSSANVNTVATNTGTANLSISSVAVTGTDAANYSVNTNTCTVTVPPGNTCSWNTVFTPTGVGTFNNAADTVTSNAATSPSTVTLNGSGQAPITTTITVTPSPVTFGNQVQGVASAPITVTVKSTGTGTFTFGTPYAQIVAGGTNPVPGDFGLSTPGPSPCSNGLALAPGISCVFNVTMIPSTLALETAQLNVNGSPNASVQISGTGLPAQTAPAPAPAIFANYPASRTMDVTVTNCLNPCRIRVTCVTGCNANAGLTAKVN